MPHKPRRRISWRTWSLIGIGVLIVAAAVGWLGSSWLGTYRQAQGVQADVATLRADLADRNWDRVRDQLPALVSSSSALESSTKGVAWRLLTAVPFVSATATAVDALAQSLAEVSAAAQPLAPYAERIITGEIRQPDGTLALDAMKDVAPLLDDLAAKLASSESRLGRIDPSGIWPAVAKAAEDFRSTAAEALPAVSTAREVATWLPGMLGSDGDRSWLVLLQNPAEARGTGGFLGGYALLRASEGRLTMEELGTSRDLNRTPVPDENAPADSQLLWGDLLTAWNTLNLSPHFPLTAQLSVDGMRARGASVDGVIALDPAAVSAMLAVTGPVEAKGIALSAENAEQFFAVDIYRDFPGATERDEVTVALMRAVFEAFLEPTWDPVALVDASRDAVGRGSVRAWSSVTDEQEWLAGLPIGGIVPDQAGSVVAVAFNNAAGNKMDAFVHTEVDYSPGRCLTHPVQASELTVKVRNDAPTGLTDINYGRLDDPSAAEGSTSMLVHVYAPVDANYLGATLDGVTYPMNLGVERNRPVWWTRIALERGQDAEISIRFEEPAVLDVEPRILTQGMVNDEVTSVSPNVDCAAAR